MPVFISHSHEDKDFVDRSQPIWLRPMLTYGSTGGNS